MPELGRGLESEIPGVSDRLPKELEKSLTNKIKPALIKKLDNMPNTGKGFRAMQILKR